MVRKSKSRKPPKPSVPESTTPAVKDSGAAPAPAEAYGQEFLLGRQLDLATRLLAAKVPVVAIKVALGKDADLISVSERV